VARYFISEGYLSVFALKGGWYAWKKAGYPVEKK
jgi:rhodanese-related sulfurtransferase